MGVRRLHHAQGGERPRREGTLEVFVEHAREWAGLAVVGVVDQDVDSAEQFDGTVHGVGDVVLLADVADHRLTARTDVSQ